ncbi:MAG: glycosyltransferase family 4 protein [Acidobacteria bacterium]|nr:glycosyltransferase family 4 protein [Acidobacteriota bacterium]
MLIGIDGIPLREIKTGVGHYTFELAKSLALSSPNDQFEVISPYNFLSLTESENRKEALPPNFHATKVKVNTLNRLWWTVGLPRYIKEKSLSLFHGTNYDIPLWKGCPTVLTIHDLSVLRYPETHKTRHVWRARRRLPLMARTATLIVTHSESIRHEVIGHFGLPREKVVAVPAAARSIFSPQSAEQTVEVRKRLGVEDEFLLFVGTIEPRKNLLSLIHAYAEVIRATGQRPQLVVAGKEGWLSDEIHARLRDSGLVERVRFTGYLSDSDLRALYSSCRIFVYPSIYEGFGLPPLEAMACGAPVIASRIPSIREVVGPVGSLVDPDDVAGLAQSITDLLADENKRRNLASAGLERAKTFSWNNAANLMREVYVKACDRFAREKGSK